MIGFVDTLVLTIAKLHSRRVLLGITILIASLLFGMVFAATFILSGIQNSMRSLEIEGHNGMYLVKASPVIPSDIYPNNVDLQKSEIDDLKLLNEQYIAKEKQAAKEQGIQFDEKSIEPPLKPSPIANPALPKEDQLMINFESPVYAEYLHARILSYAKTAKNTQKDLKDIASKYNYNDMFKIKKAGISFIDTLFLEEGKEDINYLLKNPSPVTSGLSTYGYAVNSVQNSDYQLYDSKLLDNWLLTPNTKRETNGSAIPVVITTKEAVKLFGKEFSLEDEPQDPTKKISWFKDIQTKLNGATYSSCFRNTADRLRITQAIKDLSDIKTNSDNHNYIAPVVTYSLPNEPCGSMMIKSDTRSRAEITAEQKQIDALRKLGLYDEPVNKLLHFQIVGVMDMNEGSLTTPKSIDEFSSSLFANTLDSGALIPKDIYQSSGAEKEYGDILFGNISSSAYSEDIFEKYGLTDSVLSFSTLSSARQFMKNEGCPQTELECNKLFHLDPYGSNYLLLDDFQAIAQRMLSIALLLAIFLSGVVTFFTMTRIIIDSRKETAVFRALGAKRIDVVAIYLTYGFLVSLITVVASILVGLAISLSVQYLYGGSFTDRAHVAYGLFDSTSVFMFISVEFKPVVFYLLCIIVTCLLAVILPLIRNVRRNPIADMRDE